MKTIPSKIFLIWELRTETVNARQDSMKIRKKRGQGIITLQPVAMGSGSQGRVG